MPQLTPLCRVEVQVATPLTLGQGPAGERRMVGITGGQCTGRLVGTVLPGADWQTLRPDGWTDIDARYPIHMADGAVVEVHSCGLRHGPPEIMAKLAMGERVPADSYYFRTAIRFATAAPHLQWLVRTLAIGRGVREPDRVIIDVMAVD